MAHLDPPRKRYPCASTLPCEGVQSDWIAYSKCNNDSGTPSAWPPDFCPGGHSPQSGPAQVDCPAGLAGCHPATSEPGRYCTGLIGRNLPRVRADEPAPGPLLATQNAGRRVCGRGSLADCHRAGRPLWLDVQIFDSALSAVQKHNHPPTALCPDCVAHLSQATELYQGDFMAGFSLADSNEFEEWQFFEREERRRARAVHSRSFVSGTGGRLNTSRGSPRAAAG